MLSGESGPHGTVYRASAGGPLLVLVGGPGFEPHWLGSALASTLGGIAVVLPEPEPEPESEAEIPAEVAVHAAAVRSAQVRATIASASSLGADPARVGVIGIGHGCTAALDTLALAEPHTAAAVRRLVLLTPTVAPQTDLGIIPPTFLQSAPQSATLAASRSLEIDLREAGVAVRPVEYIGLPDAWVRYPRFTPGSKRALEDIVTFLRRGFGLAGTFSGEIPGWDLR